MSEPDSYVSAVQFLFHELIELIDLNRSEVEAQLIMLLENSKSDPTAGTSIRKLLRPYKDVNDLISVYRASKESRDVGEGERNYYPLPGNPPTIHPVLQYICPVCKKTWLQRDAGESIPFCDEHSPPVQFISDTQS